MDFDTELDTLARTIWAEARGEGYDGMAAVAAVIRNRTKAAKAYFNRYKKVHPLFGDGSYSSACLSPWQFSCWNSNDPNRSKLLAVDSKDEKFVMAQHIAFGAIRGMIGALPDLLGSLHYHTKAVKPSWSRGKYPVVALGNHVFYNNIG